jgi:integrase
MAKVNFNLKDPNAETSLIILRYYLPTGRLVRSTGITIPTIYWNSREQVIRKSEAFPEGPDLQFRLHQIEVAVKKVERSHFPDASLFAFRKALDEELKSDVQANALVLPYLESFIQSRTKDRQYRPESIKVYKTLRKHFRNFVGKRPVEFQDLDYDLLNGFVNYLRNNTTRVKEGYSDNHIHKILSTLRTVIHEAQANGININPAYQRVKVGKKDADNIYLSNDEISAMYQLDLTGPLEETRDLFVIGCYTGLRYSDYSRLTPDNLIKLPNGKDAFRIIVFKTHQKVVIPLHPVVIEILEKYQYELPQGSVNQVMNQHLKEIALMAGLTSNYQKRIFRANRDYYLKL